MMVCHELKVLSVKFNPFEFKKKGRIKNVIGNIHLILGRKSPSKNKNKERNHEEDG